MDAKLTCPCRTQKLVTASTNGHDVEVVKLIENLNSDGTNLDLQDSVRERGSAVG